MSRGGAEGEGDTESEAGSRLWSVSTEPNAGLELMNRWDHDLGRSWTLYQLSHPVPPILWCFYWVQYTSRKMLNHKYTAQWIFTKRTHPQNKGKNVTKTSRDPLCPLVPTHTYRQARLWFLTAKFSFAYSIIQYVLMYLAALLKMMQKISLSCGLINLLKITLPLK